MLDYRTTIPKIRALLDKHGLHDWQCSLENLANTAMGYPACGLWGQCDHSNKVIRVSGDCPAREFRQTMLHEIAHAKCGPGHGHDETWQEMANSLGVTFSRILPYFSPQVRKLYWPGA